MIKTDRHRQTATENHRISGLMYAIEQFFQISLTDTKFLLLKLMKIATCYEVLPHPKEVDFFWKSKSEALAMIDFLQKNFLPNPMQGKRIVVPFKNVGGEEMICIIFFDGETVSDMEYPFWEPYARCIDEYDYRFLIPIYEPVPKQQSIA